MMQRFQGFQLSDNDSQKETITLSSNNQHQQPKDTISCIKWIPIPNNQMFVCSTWGGELIFYQCVFQQYPVLQTVNYFEYNHPILTCQWKSDASCVFFAGGDGSLMCYQINNNKYNNQQVFQIDQYQLPAIGIFYVNQYDILLVINCEGEIILYNAQNFQNPPIKTKLDFPAICCDFIYPLVMIGLMEQKMVLFNLETLLKNNQYKFEYKESQLGKTSPLQCVAISPDLNVIGLSSLDGRGNISKLKKIDQYNMLPTYTSDNIITFKGHKEDRSQPSSYYRTPQKFQDLYPINSIAFNIKNKHFLATLGADGKIIYWDYDRKNKIVEYQFSGRAISTGAITYDGEFLAFGLGYDWNQGIQGVGGYPPSIHVLRITDKELYYRGN
ncbi:hypothetical protein ABPG74_003069 [Tetrahymena malaccensis]